MGSVVDLAKLYLTQLHAAKTVFVLLLLLQRRCNGLTQAVMDHAFTSSSYRVGGKHMEYLFMESFTCSMRINQ